MSWTPRWLPYPVAAGVAVALLQVGADAAARSSWEGVSPARHTAAALSLQVAVWAAVAAGVSLAGAGFQSLERRFAERHPRRAPLLGPVVGALCAALASFETAVWTFSGERISGTWLSRLGPPAGILAAAIAGAAAVVATRRVLGLAERGRKGAAVTLSFGLLAVAVGLIRVDLTVYVALYARLHGFIELVAAACAFLAAAIGQVVVVRSMPKSAGILRGASLLGTSVLVLFVLLSPLRVWVDDALRHAWREPVYVGRTLSRVQLAEGFIRDPRGWRGATMSSVVRLRERYDIATTTRAPAWDAPLAEPPWLRDRIAALRGSQELNVVFFYVDTLRADVARDPRFMPSTVAFARRSLEFRRAYTTGSDTLHALPGIVGGSYDLFGEHPNDLLHVASGAGYRSGLVVAQSAHEFLERLFPQFRFDDTLLVPDYATGNENVWGYGADQPTAGRIVDKALDWLRGRGKEPFFLWLFHFDVHNWRELDDAHLREVGKGHGIFDEADPIWRYRAAARSVDAQLGRFLAGLEEMGHAGDTMIVFLSDHGEGLGREGFWVHSVFLWEGLVHVPLLVHVPRVPPAVVDEVVSVVDIAPTVARSMATNADTVGYHGEDLLSYLVPGRPKRRLPLMMMSTLREVPVRLGIIDPEEPWKLVLPLEGVVPELYDLRAPDPDAIDVARGHERETLRLLNDLVRAPMFPRLTEASTDGPLDQAARAGRAAIAYEAAREERLRLEAAASASTAPRPTTPPPPSGAPHPDAAPQPGASGASGTSN